MRMGSRSLSVSRLSDTHLFQKVREMFPTETQAKVLEIAAAIRTELITAEDAVAFAVSRRLEAADQSKRDLVSIKNSIRLTVLDTVINGLIQSDECVEEMRESATRRCETCCGTSATTFC